MRAWNLGGAAGQMVLAMWCAGMVCSGADPMRRIDFTDSMEYPFLAEDTLAVPEALRWMPNTDVIRVRVRRGRYVFPCEDEPCPALTIDQVNFGKVDGLPGSTAVVTATYHSGGSATWQYLYVESFSSDVARTVAWLETGSRAYMGLRGVSFVHGDLVVTVNDPGNRHGDCCSSGTITFRYRWDGSAFVPVGRPEVGRDRE